MKYYRILFGLSFLKPKMTVSVLSHWMVIEMQILLLENKIIIFSTVLPCSIPVVLELYIVVLEIKLEGADPCTYIYVIVIEVSRKNKNSLKRKILDH